MATPSLPLRANGARGRRRGKIQPDRAHALSYGYVALTGLRMREEDISDRAHALPYGYVALAGLRMSEEGIQDRGHALSFVMSPLQG